MPPKKANILFNYTNFIKKKILKVINKMISLDIINIFLICKI